MLHSLGRRPPSNDDPESLLLECHGRIRRFLQIARALSASAGGSEPSLPEAAESVRRYFAEALPLHVRDEDETLSAHLAGRWPACDEALRRMTGEHADHVELISGLVALAGRLAKDRGRHAEVAPALARLLERLEPALEVHLAAEERDVLPFLSRLSPDERLAMVREMRARRA